MDSSFVFRAAASAKCLARTMLPSSGSKILSAVQSVSIVLLRPMSAGAFSATRTQRLLATDSTKNPVVSVSGILGSRVPQQASTQPAPVTVSTRAFTTTTGTTKLPASAPVCPAFPRLGLGLGSSGRPFSTTSTTTTALTSTPLMGGPSASGPQSSLLQVSTPAITTTRGRAQIYYRPSAWKRVNKHGIERKLRSPGGIEVLWRRFLKKRHCLTPFDRIIPGTYGGQVLPKHHLKYNQQLVRRDVRKRIDQTLGKRKN